MEVQVVLVKDNIFTLLIVSSFIAFKREDIVLLAFNVSAKPQEGSSMAVGNCFEAEYSGCSNYFIIIPHEK